MSHKYASYSTSDFDKFDCLKVSKIIYLVLIFVLRGYLVWLMSVSNLRDKVGVIQWVYPEPGLFYLSLVSGSMGLYVLLILSLRRPDADNWVKTSWKNIRTILLCSLIFDLIINIVGYFYWQLQSAVWIFVNFSTVLGFCLFLYSSKRVNININEFPEKVPE